MVSDTQRVILPARKLTLRRTKCAAGTLPFIVEDEVVLHLCLDRHERTTLGLVAPHHMAPAMALMHYHASLWHALEAVLAELLIRPRLWYSVAICGCWVDRAT